MKQYPRCAMELICLLTMVLAASLGAAQEKPSLAKQAKEVLKANCYRCHGEDGTVEGGINYILDLNTLVTRKKVDPKNPAKSMLLQRVVAKEMPPEDEKPRPSESDIAILKQWIEAGATDSELSVRPREFISSVDIFKAIRADIFALNERDRRFTRYFTITHLFNAGVSEDELQTYRNGLSKLANSLSWGRKIVLPQPIDPAKTIFRIDLRDFKWSEKVWDAILAANPYGVTYTTTTATDCYTATGTKVPFVRADWFVAAAAHPPLYHQVLEMPQTDGELEKQLKVDVDENIKAERVARAGFNGSGVSRNNRMVERHESTYGAYWKSYDFGSNAGQKNLFAFPAGPGKGSHDFAHDGGEIIFNLPNGLQAYMLVDQKGNRLDKGPASIVSDPKRPDRAVENGISCMSCHVKGMIEKADQIRDHVEKNTIAFSKKEAGSILALYPAKDKFLALVKDDAARFQKAVQETGSKIGATEPIVALTLRFEAELDLRLAAAELGLKANEFKTALERSPTLARTFGTLNVEGGTVQRDVFVASFGDSVKEMRLGVYVERSPAVAKTNPILAFDSADMFKLSQEQLVAKYSGREINLAGLAVRMEHDKEKNADFFNVHVEYIGPQGIKRITFGRLYFVEDVKELRDQIRQGKSVKVSVQGKFFAAYPDKKDGGVIVLKDCKMIPVKK